jgi:hypothetical protein
LWSFLAFYNELECKELRNEGIYIHLRTISSLYISFLPI